jgi:hypothetical protein
MAQVFADYKRCTANSLRQENAMRATRRRITVVLICVASAFTCEIALGEHHKQRSGPPEQFSADNHRGHSTARGQFPPHHPTDVSSGVCRSCAGPAASRSWSSHLSLRSAQFLPYMRQSGSMVPHSEPRRVPQKSNALKGDLYVSSGGYSI